MSDAIKKLRDYLAKSPSVVYPEVVLVYYLPAIEDENAKLRELVMMAYKAVTEPDCADCYNEHSCKNNDLSYCVMWVELEQKMRDELGVEAPE